eukprot:10805654-Karenia_brevis.AAC.1
MGKTKFLHNIVDAGSQGNSILVCKKEVEIIPPGGSTMYLGRALSLTDVHDTELTHRIARAWK